MEQNILVIGSLVYKMVKEQLLGQMEINTSVEEKKDKLMGKEPLYPQTAQHNLESGKMEI